MRVAPIRALFKDAGFTRERREKEIVTLLADVERERGGVRVGSERRYQRGK